MGNDDDAVEVVLYYLNEETKCPWYITIYVGDLLIFLCDLHRATCVTR